MNNKKSTIHSERLNTNFVLSKQMKVWKCYRCNLTFKDESIAIIHKDISGHSGQQIELILA